ncbi:NAD(P)/FAD-dependent oxidoreductase [Synechococcus elongatus]|uniref:Type 2 NADH dehydrogenase n=2 Tax=Synechococcus elongatus TaxID=32046 RepID=Q31RT9_SYNE7|nr:NAD(P)/FAD-dependent oxidoreductase [Synechococcus elongatus]ABB56230.1 type 2 NADH dehydrogenase [Synechococcus elongatus PCC 7942 = FACHB-805]AJD56719.1 NADH dehydrogenase [Synechococcus elongatus UTEX 2973]MBD2588062.1 NAD(P)/FAD-dependent oxidoreductase [Synechococcus elongatus FACHB-242]MBD2689130.1 NAD(P)/FAD-dependent oxidoreductase [Synechococcus elongatus FACHB-1061]MBD2707230.1 NAD(P)/FAD-dependent oxidoreductase [Synechococcus elongatus PCC 7942 = FACHB-805]
MIASTSIAKPTVIVGGGFVGLFCALHLRHRHYPAPIILIDPKDRFIFRPLLFDFLSGELSDEQVWPRYEELLQGSEVEFIQDAVSAIDLVERSLTTAQGLTFDYGHLVLGLGATQGYFGTPGAADYAFAFRDRDHVVKLEQHLRQRLQKASQIHDRQQRRDLLTIAVVGAGPSGIEMVALLADWLPLHYGRLGGDPQDLRLILVNRSPEILKGDANASLHDLVLEELQQRQMPVELLLGVAVEAVTPEGLQYRRSGTDALEQVRGTVIWTAGVSNNPLLSQLEIPASDRDRHGMPYVLPTLQLLGYPEVFAAGDCAVVKEQPQPGLAQVAYQQGAAIAHNLLALSHNQPLSPAKVSLRGTLMGLGIDNAVANLLNRYRVTGKPGSLLRKATYLELLPTPLHNFKATMDWLSDELFQGHSDRPQTLEQREAGISRAIAITIVSLVAILGGFFATRLLNEPRSPQPPQSIPTQPAAPPTP